MKPSWYIKRKNISQLPEKLIGPLRIMIMWVAPVRFNKIKRQVDIASKTK
jgi:hypothetical protein